MKPENVKCPECDGPMVSRKSQHGVFWGCKQFPKCKGTRNADGEGRRQRFDADGEVVDTPANLSGAARALVEQMVEYLAHKPDCALRKPKVYEAGFYLDEQDDELVTISTRKQIDGPGKDCTCGLSALLAQAGAPHEEKEKNDAATGAA